MDDEISKAAAAMGRKGGKVRSEAKTAAAQENGRKGGRPLRNKTIHDMWEETKDYERVKAFIEEETLEGSPVRRGRMRFLEAFDAEEKRAAATPPKTVSMEELKADIATAYNAVMDAHPRGQFGVDFLEEFVEEIKKMGYTKNDIEQFRELSDREWELMPSRVNILGQTGTRGPFEGINYYSLANVVCGCISDPKRERTDVEKFRSNLDLAVWNAEERAGDDDGLFNSLFIDNMRFFGYSEKDLDLIKKAQSYWLKSEIESIKRHGDYAGLTTLLYNEFSKPEN
jgi:hypothetical protein